MLTDPQYAVVKQLRIPVAVVITFRIREVMFRLSDRMPWGTLTRKELSRSCLDHWISVAEFGLLIVRCRKGDVGSSARLI